MIHPNHNRMLGVARQPFCGKCCGRHDKPTNTIYKRAVKRHDRQEFRAEVDRGAWNND